MSEPSSAVATGSQTHHARPAQRPEKHLLLEIFIVMAPVPTNEWRALLVLKERQLSDRAR